jgi:hypothetical protein
LLGVKEDAVVVGSIVGVGVDVGAEDVDKKSDVEEESGVGVEVDNKIVEESAVVDAGVIIEVGRLAVNPLVTEKKVSDGRVDAGASSDVGVGRSDCVEEPRSTEKGSPHVDVWAVVVDVRPRRDKRPLKRRERMVGRER